MDEESRPFLDRLVPTGAERVLGHPDAHAYRLQLADLDGVGRVGVLTTGIGLANAAAGAAWALTLAVPDLVVNAGTTGGLRADVRVGDVIAGTSALYHAANADAFGYAPGQIPQMPPLYASPSELRERARRLGSRVAATVREGLVVSGDSFVTAATVEDVRARFPRALATDMESAATAEVCYALGVPWLSLRAASDLCGPQAGQEWHIAGDRAAALSRDAVLALLAPED